MKLEDLVPPLELCKQIPQGEFEDTAFAWTLSDVVGFTCRTSGCEQFSGQEWQIIRSNASRMSRARKRGEETYPAPTLQEIMRNIPTPYDAVFCRYWDGDGDRAEEQWNMGDSECDLYVKNGYEGQDPTELALMWWLKQKGITK